MDVVYIIATTAFTSATLDKGTVTSCLNYSDSFLALLSFSLSIPKNCLCGRYLMFKNRPTAVPMPVVTNYGYEAYEFVIVAGPCWGNLFPFQ